MTNFFPISGVEAIREGQSDAARKRLRHAAQRARKVRGNARRRLSRSSARSDGEVTLSAWRNKTLRNASADQTAAKAGDVKQVNTSCRVKFSAALTNFNARLPRTIENPLAWQAGNSRGKQQRQSWAGNPL